MLYQSHDSIYRNTQWSPQQKGVLTDLLSEHDFKYVCADAISRMLTYALSRLCCFTLLYSAFTLLPGASGPHATGLCALPR